MNALPADDRAAATDFDPIFLHSRREAIVIVGVWLAMLLWVVPYCWLNGYQLPADPSEVATVWGVPSWVFWGIAVPWLVADVVTVWFCFGYMREDDLGEAPEMAAARAAAESERG